jgi:hypothetical protein
MKNAYKYVVFTPQWKTRDLGIDGRIILNQISSKRHMNVWTGFN